MPHNAKPATDGWAGPRVHHVSTARPGNSPPARPAHVAHGFETAFSVHAQLSTEQVSRAVFHCRQQTLSRAMNHRRATSGMRFTLPAASSSNVHKRRHTGLHLRLAARGCRRHRSRHFGAPPKAGSLPSTAVPTLSKTGQRHVKTRA
jgi:hypothetical protein